jgi:protein-tyrosine phosphatase
MGLVDLHAHFLPGLDDGARNLADGLAILRGLAELGYDRVTATPHQKAAQYLPERSAIDAAYMEVSVAWAAAGRPMELGLAAENYWDDVFFGRWQDGTFPTYDGGKAFLFEIRHDLTPLRFEDALFQLQLKGFRPVMAHPERYAPFWHKEGEARLARIAEAGCSLLVDLGAVSGAHGGPQKKAARRLLEGGLAHAVASDAHTIEDVKASRDGLAWIKSKLGPGALTRLADENPRRILRGETPK